MNPLARILILDDNSDLVKEIEDLVRHPQIEVKHSTDMPEQVYDFYILGDGIDIVAALDALRNEDEQIPIYLTGDACQVSVQLWELVGCQILGCLESEKDMKRFHKHVSSFWKSQACMREASQKLDALKAGDLDTLSTMMLKTESERFVDFIQNHPISMVLVSRRGDILHANASMEKMIGTKLAGMPASSFWKNPDDFTDAMFYLEKEGQLLGKEVTLKNMDGEDLPLKLYSNLHYGDDGDWLNTRCLFIPCN